MPSWNELLEKYLGCQIFVATSLEPAHQWPLQLDLKMLGGDGTEGQGETSTYVENGEWDLLGN